jgi:L,D-transpeptidase YcbB
VYRLIYSLILLVGVTAAGANILSTSADETAALAPTHDSVISQAIRSNIESMHDAGAKALTIGALNLAQAVTQFYETRDFTPAWNDNERVEQLLIELENLRGDGLEPEDYYLSQLRAQFARLPPQRADSPLTEAGATQQRADFDLLATNAYLRSLAHLFRGKVKPTTESTQWNFSINNIASDEAMKIVNAGIANNDIAAVYRHARPQHPLYARAQIGLGRLRAMAAQGGWPKINNTVTLKPGDHDPQVVLLRRRFFPVTANTADPNDEFFDEALAEAVRKFQREQYLDDDGAIGPATRAALNISIQQRIDQVRVNLERARWLLHELHDDFVLVDVAGYKIYFYKNGQQTWRSNVQVGKPYRSTPIFKSKITYITFNPTWTVPPTILRKDILPKLKKDISYLEKNNIRVLDDTGRELNPKTIDWNKPGNITLRQDAGDDAALGQVVIRFPNDYAVYLHDTPHRELFVSEQRAFSSGCIRVERPLELVELLFNDAEKWNRAAIDQIIAQGKTRNVDLAKPVPVLLAYWTIDLFEDGDIGFKPDIYGRDPAVLKALNAKL